MDKTVGLNRNKRAVILLGSPGSSKTSLSNRLASYLDPEMLLVNYNKKDREK